MDKKDLEKLWILFKTSFQLSAFTFGGGYVIVSLMREKFVEELGWIEEEEMLDLVAIAQSSPGAVAVNGAIAVGYKIQGWPGVIVAVIATILPPFLIISIISYFYESFSQITWIRLILEGMNAGIAAVIGVTVFNMASVYFKAKDSEALILMLVAFVLNYFFEVPVVFIILGSGLYALVRALVGNSGGDA